MSNNILTQNDIQHVDYKDVDLLKQFINPHSLEVVTAKCEPSLEDAKPELRYQFERLGYFAVDKDSSLRAPNSTLERLVFNRTITLRDTWAKEAQKI